MTTTVQQKLAASAAAKAAAASAADGDVALATAQTNLAAQVAAQVAEDSSSSSGAAPSTTAGSVGNANEGDINKGAIGHVPDIKDGADFNELVTVTVGDILDLHRMATYCIRGPRKPVALLILKRLESLLPKGTPIVHREPTE